MSPYEKKAPRLDTISNLVARSSTSPAFEMPSLNMMSNSAVRKGGATLFLTILTRVRLPMTSSPTLMDWMRRTSMRMEA